MVVHSFSPVNRWRDTFDRLVEVIGGSDGSDEPVTVAVPSGKALMLGWASGAQEFRQK